MHFSIESRTPFADDIDLMNYIFSIPSNFKLHNTTSKSILRDAMESYLPGKIYKRKDKMGFVTPNNNWLSGLKSELRDILNEMDDNIFNKPLLSRILIRFYPQHLPLKTIEYSSLLVSLSGNLGLI